MPEHFSKEQWKQSNAQNPNFNPEEFDFHQQRFEKKAEKYSKSLFKKIFHPLTDLNAIDFAHEEALQENEERDQMQNSAELKEWQEMRKPVIEHMKIKRDFPESEEAKKIKILVIALAGGMRGAYGDGQAMALEKMGFFKNKIIQTIIGTSAGAKTAAFALAGQIALGASLFYRKGAAKLMSLKPSRWPKMWDVGSYIGQVEKTLDQQAVMDSPTELFMQVSDAKNGTPKLVDAKEDLIHKLHAASAVPWLYGEKVELKKEKIKGIDGGVESIELQEIIEKFHPTDILILPNMPFDETDTFKLSRTEKTVLGLARLFPKKTGFAGNRQKIFGRKQEFRKSLQSLRAKTGINVGVLFPPNIGLSAGKTDPELIKQAIYASANSTLDAFGEPDKAKEIKLL